MADDTAARLTEQIGFILEIDRLKQVVRRGILADGSRRENTAEHSWHLAMMVLMLAEHANDPIDVRRCLELVLIHDLVEIDAGDTFLYDEVGRADKAEREQAAADRIFSLLPDDQASWVRQRWDEYEAAATAESRFAHSVDRLAPLLLNRSGGGEPWAANGIVESQVRAANAHIADGSEVLGAFAAMVIDQAVALGMVAQA